MPEALIKKDLENLRVAIEKKIDVSLKAAVGDFTEVVQDIMSLAATRTDVQDFREHVDEKFKVVEHRLDDTATKEDVRKIERKVDDLDVKFDVIKKVTIDDHEKRIAKLERQTLHA